METTSNDHTATLLEHLSHKQDVQRTLIISRTSGAIIEAYGYPSSRDTVKNNDNGNASDNDDDESRPGNAAQPDRDADAKLVFSHVQSTHDLVSKLGDAAADEDELQLLRIRTRRHEFMIVPDARYIAVVVKATATA